MNTFITRLPVRKEYRLKCSGSSTGSTSQQKQWAKIAKCSTDTALNDIKDLIAKDILRKNEGGGRSTSYTLVR